MFAEKPFFSFFFFNDTATTEIYTLSLHDALPIYHRRDRRGLPRSGRSRDQHQAARTVGERPHDDGEPELLERWDLGANTADREPDQPALTEHVDPEATDALQGVADVRFVRGLELASLVLAHDRQGERVRILRRQLAEGRRLEVPVHPEERHVADLQMEVARAPLHGVPKQLVDIHPGFRFGTIAPEPEPGSLTATTRTSWPVKTSPRAPANRRGGSAAGGGDRNRPRRRRPGRRAGRGRSRHRRPDHGKGRSQPAARGAPAREPRRPREPPRRRSRRRRACPTGGSQPSARSRPGGSFTGEGTTTSRSS